MAADTSSSQGTQQPVPSLLPSGQRKCAIQECQSPCFVDEAGTVHECCGFTHAMEHQRRKAIEQRKRRNALYRTTYVTHRQIVGGVTYVTNAWRVVTRAQQRSSAAIQYVTVCFFPCREAGDKGSDTLPASRMQPTCVALQELLRENTCRHWLTARPCT